ncbi:hypothetical protein CYMTET_19564, partial [Cymbomonas tetramitiformis]
MEGYTPLGAAGTTAPTGVGATEGVGLAAEHLLEPPRSESGCARCREYAPLGHPRTEAVAMEEVQVEMPSTPAPLEPTRAAKPAALPVPKKPLPSYLKIQPGKADAVKVKAGAGITPTPTPRGRAARDAEYWIPGMREGFEIVCQGARADDAFPFAAQVLFSVLEVAMHLLAPCCLANLLAPRCLANLLAPRCLANLLVTRCLF